MFNQQQINNLLIKIYYLLLGILIFKIGTNIPVYGISSTAIINIDNQFNKVLDSLNLFSGGALSRASIFSLALMPSISASIFIQILTYKVDFFINHSKTESGKDYIKRFTRCLTVLIALFQGFYLTDFFYSNYSSYNIIYLSETDFYFTSILSLVIGSMIVTWLAEQISERGIGNGVSLIIYIGIVSSLPNLIKDYNIFLKDNIYSLFGIILISLFMISIIYFVVYIESIQKRIKISTIKQHHKETSTEKEYLPFKINISGIMPVIIAGLFVSLPLSIISFFTSLLNITSLELEKLKILFSIGHSYHFIFMGFFIFFFSIYYIKLINYKSTIITLINSRNIVINGIRPGLNTEKYIGNLINKLSIVSSFYLFLLVIIPEFFIFKLGFSFYFGGTSLLIIVLTSIDWIKEIKSHFYSLKYKKLENKINKVFNDD